MLGQLAAGWAQSGHEKTYSARGKTVVSIRGDQFYINGKPTYPGRYWKGHKVEGLLINARMVQGIFDDLSPTPAPEFAYADTKRWDAERNNREFVAAMPLWYKQGLNAFTLNMQGGSPYGYGNKAAQNPGYHPDGSLMQLYMQRLDKILKEADRLGMVVILGLFYFGQDQHLQNERAVINATLNLTDWILQRGYQNVLIEATNETGHKTYDHSILMPDRINEIIALVKSREHKGRRLLAGTSFLGRVVPTSNVVKASDFLLLHGNGAHSPGQIQEQIDSTRKVEGYRTMPIVNNEDDHYDFDKSENNLLTAIKNYVSWGYFDFRRKDEADLAEGYQSIPVNWGISSERKKAFFNAVKEITGGHGPSMRKQTKSINK